MNKQDVIICKRYAEAFFQSMEEHDYEECFKDFKAFVALYFSNDELRQVLSHPIFRAEKKVELIQRIFGGQICQLVNNFICLLIKRKRLGFLKTISYEVSSLYRHKKNIRGIVIKTSVPLLVQEREKLMEVLHRKFGEIDAREVVDPKIIGGIVLYFGNQVIDESVRSRLNRLRETMIEIDTIWMATLINQPSVAL